MHAQVTEILETSSSEQEAKVFAYMRSQFINMRRHGIQKWWFTLQKGHKYSLWTFLNISEEDGGRIAEFTDLNSMNKNQIHNLFAERMQMKLQSDFVRECDVGGNRPKVLYHRVEQSINCSEFEDLPPEHKKIGPGDRGMKGDLYQDFCSFKSSRLGNARRHETPQNLDSTYI